MAAAKKASIPVDDNCPLKGAAVHEDYDCILNQTNIGANNNKFYVIQLLTKAGKFYAWTRWGRVGETGQSALVGPSSFEGALKAFEAKFKDKTSNKWTDRAKFKPASGRYSLIEVDRSASAEKAGELEEKLKDIDKQAAKLSSATAKKFKASTLHPRVQNFMNLIFDQDMFKGAMASFDIDVKKMPLGQLSMVQVNRGFDVLEQLRAAIKSKKSAKIMEYTSRFYTVIPHAFGRNVPPLINTIELADKKQEMLNVLSDIELAMSLAKDEQKPQKAVKLSPHPADENYKKLNAELELVAPGSEEHDLLLRYLNETAASHNKPKVLDIFRLDRNGEAARFKAHDALTHRKLLWHGTNVAVVAAICKSGLRIMPHSGGRVGKGIYSASENGKSINYMGWAKNLGVMFLAEVALGKEHSITRDDSSLKAAPKGFDSVVARGRTEPDPKKDVVRKYDGKNVIIPTGKPIKMAQHSKSSFSQSEYLVYKESQIRLRYAVHVQS